MPGKRSAGTGGNRQQKANSTGHFLQNKQNRPLLLDNIRFMEQWHFLGTLTALQSNFFCKTLDSDTLKIYISAQVSSFTHEKQLKIRNFRPVCGEE